MAGVLDVYDRLHQQAEQAVAALESPEGVLIQVGSATCEITAGADKVRDEFRKLCDSCGTRLEILRRLGG